jgi:aarF domain-containing kinase
LIYGQVPSFPDDVAMNLLEEELGMHWSEIYSELSPSPIAAGNFYGFPNYQN